MDGQRLFRHSPVPPTRGRHGAAGQRALPRSPAHPKLGWPSVSAPDLNDAERSLPRRLYADLSRGRGASRRGPGRARALGQRRLRGALIGVVSFWCWPVVAGGGRLLRDRRTKARTDRDRAEGGRRPGRRPAGRGSGTVTRGPAPRPCCSPPPPAGRPVAAGLGEPRRGAAAEPLRCSQFAMRAGAVVGACSCPGTPPRHAARSEPAGHRGGPAVARRRHPRTPGVQRRSIPASGIAFSPDGELAGNGGEPVERGRWRHASTRSRST